MASRDVRLERSGVLAVLTSNEVRDAVHDLAEETAGNVRASVPGDVEVVVDDYTTDRAASSVTIKDVRGRLWEARDGVLTRAAAAAGLEVKHR